MLKGNRKWWVLLACAAFGAPAVAGELELGGEGYTFTLRDTDNSNAPPYEPLDLSGLGGRAYAGLTFDGGAQRVSLVVQRVRDDVHESWGYSSSYSSSRSEADTGVAFLSVDARYEPRVVASERFELRLQSGYRFARAILTERESHTYTSYYCPRCGPPSPYWWANEDRRTGHGIRAGLASDLRLVGPLHLESEAGLSLLAATDTWTYSNSYSNNDRSESRHSAATWDVSARLRAECKGVSVSLGYRFDRWTALQSYGSDPGFDGFTFGLGWRFGL